MSPKRQRGFSLIELIVVVAVILAVSALAAPKFLNAIYNIRLRSSAFELSGMLQAVRMQAVQDNRYYYLCYAANNGVTQAWVSATGTCGTAPAATDKQVQLGGNVRIVTSGAPAGIGSVLSFPAPTSVLVTAKPAFGARGLPCYVSGSVCKTIAVTLSGNQVACYLLYLTDTRPVGSNGWAAVSVSPAGRMQVWTYNGSNWGH